MVFKVKNYNVQFYKFLQTYLNNIKNYIDYKAEHIPQLLRPSVRVTTPKGYVDVPIRITDKEGNELNKIPQFPSYIESDIADSYIVDLLKECYIDHLLNKIYYGFEDNIPIIEDYRMFCRTCLSQAKSVEDMELDIREYITNNEWNMFGNWFVSIFTNNKDIHISPVSKLAPRFIALNYLCGYIPISSYTLDNENSLNIFHKIQTDVHMYRNTVANYICESIEPIRSSNPMNIVYLHYKCLNQI